MGRPIKKKFFGSLTTPFQNQATGGNTGVGGEGAESVAVTGTFGGKTPATYTIPASVISAPQITGGVKPTMTLTYLTASTAIVTVVTAGSGYTGTVTISGAALQALGGAGTGTIVLTATMTTTRPDTLSFASRIIGGTAQTTGDIMKQEGSRRYLIQNSDGKGICKLVAKANGSLLAGEMNLVATDANGNTYYVTKLSARKARLKRLTQSGSNAWLVADGAQAGWNVGSATGSIVTIANTV